MARQKDAEPDPDVAARTGNFAMLMYSIVGVFAGTLLPHFSKRDKRLLDPDYPESDEGKFIRIQRTVQTLKRECENNNRTFRLPRMPVALRDMWCFALVFFAIISLWTFFINTVAEVGEIISLIRVNYSKFDDRPLLPSP